MWQSMWQCDNASKLTVIVTRTKFLSSSAIMLLCGLYIYQLWLSGWEDCPTFHIGFKLSAWQRALLLTMIQLSSHSTKQLSFNLSVATGACFKSSSYSRAESYVATSHPPCITKPKLPLTTNWKALLHHRKKYETYILRVTTCQPRHDTPCWS